MDKTQLINTLLDIISNSRGTYSKVITDIAEEKLHKLLREI